jgi:tRNA dimethylallyltransferase
MKSVIIIAGPTASGKTALAIEVAKKLNTEIISADSRQCYKELNIGVARPSPEELKAVKHHFIGTHSIHEKVTAATFEQYALQKVDELFKDHDVVVMAGGTGLYIKAFTEGMDEIPDVPELVRNEIITSYNSKGLQWLQDQVQEMDPDYFQSGETKNPQRLMRALEVFKSTGRSILSYQKRMVAKRNFSVVKIAVEISKEDLHRNINHRVDQMVEHGLADEVFSLIPYSHLNALQTVGYKELFDHFNGEISLSDAIEQIKKNTRQYAKRQLTWFRKDPEWQWVEAGKALELITSKVKDER